MAQDQAAAPAEGPAAELPEITLIMKSLGSEFFKVMEEGAIKYAEERGDLVLTPLGTQTQEELDQQLQLVENTITQKADAIVIAPMDSQALVRPLKEAVDAGIAVINIDVMLDEASKKEFGLDLGFVGPDNVEAARMVGEVLADELGPGGKVIIIEGIPAAINAEQRKQGFIQAIEDGGLELLTSNTAGWETEKAFSLTSDLLTRYPEVQGIMAANDAMAIGVVQALDAAGRNDVKVVGFDHDPSIRPLIKEGKVLATIEQFAAAQAAIGISVAMDTLATGEKLEGWMKTPVVLITAENVGQEYDVYELME
jgi:ribose transport system substrate-binding protein